VVPYSYYLLLAAILFTIGAAGILIRRNAIIMLMCIEMMMNAVNLTFITLSCQLNSIDGQVIAFIVMAVAAVEVAVGLAIVVSLQRHRESVDVDDFGSLKG
jgi:NADH-quinone oxidoreductase subunit K